MKGEVISQVGTATIKITSTFQRDRESNAIHGDAAEGVLQGTQRTNSPAVVKLLQRCFFSTESQYNLQQTELFYLFYFCVSKLFVTSRRPTYTIQRK